jgi:hypothetical protein
MRQIHGQRLSEQARSAEDILVSASVISGQSCNCSPADKTQSPENTDKKAEKADNVSHFGATGKSVAEDDS